jgi:hypothetical protein
MFKLNVNTAVEKLQVEAQANLAKRIKRHENTVLAYLLLNGEDELTYKPNALYLDEVFEVKKADDFRAIHRAIGELEESAMHPANDDARTRLVNVYLKPKDPQFSHLNFKYQKRLDRGQKCKVVSEMRRVTRLVCDN